MLRAQDLYDTIPIYYCSKCLSLKILRLDMDNPDMCYCDDCGNTDIRKASIEDWEKLYKTKYKQLYLKIIKNY